MDPIERTLRTLDGKSADRVPTFCAMVEDSTFNEVLGRPLISQERLIANPAARYVLDRWGTRLTGVVFQPELNRALEKRIRAQVELGFDALWAIHDETFIVLDHRTMARYSGSIFNLQPDGYGNMTYMYRGPATGAGRNFEAWPHWPGHDDLAHSTLPVLPQDGLPHGHRACLFGRGPVPTGYRSHCSGPWASTRCPCGSGGRRGPGEALLDLTEELWPQDQHGPRPTRAFP
jgi:hypothetical protein